MNEKQAVDLYEDQRPWYRRPMPVLVVGSVLFHVVLAAVLGPMAKSSMLFNMAENEGRAQEVSAREMARKEVEKQQRANTTIPKEHREELKKEAKRKEEKTMRERVEKMLTDREKALEQREEAFERMRKREKEDYVRDKVVPPVKEALKNTDEMVKAFVEAKPQETKDAQDLEREARLEELKAELKEELANLEKNLAAPEDALAALKQHAEEMRDIARQEAADRGGQVHQPAWTLANEANDIKNAVEKAEIEAKEAEILNDTSTAEQIAEAPKPDSQSPGPEGQEQSKGSGEDLAQLYDAAKEIEKQVEQASKDTRAAEIATRTGSSFSAAKAKVASWSPERPQLGDALKENEAKTLGDLNQFREAAANAAVQVASMATRTSSLTRQMESVINRARNDAPILSGAAVAALSNRSSAESSLGVAGEVSFGSGTGNSQGGRDILDQGSIGAATPDRKANAELPETLINAQALPGRMFTEDATRKGWLYIDTWYVIGPWENRADTSFKIPRPPEQVVDFENSPGPVMWHYFQPHDEVGVIENPFTHKLDVTHGSHPQGYHFTYDEVQNALMRAAAFTFRDGQLPPAPKPTQFIFGRGSLHDPASMDYAGSYGKPGMDMFQTTYQYGVRIKIDPTREGDEVIGPVVSFAERLTHNPYTPVEEILFDWKQGFLRFDAPAVAAYTGLIARQGNQHSFTNGVKLRDVRVINPEGIADPVSPEENYIAFALYSQDGQPLEKTGRAALSLMSTSFNTGFRLGTEMDVPYHIPKGTVPGDLPVLVARVGATVEAPALRGMKYTAYDWNRRVIATGTVEDGLLPLDPAQPTYVIEFSR